MVLDISRLSFGYTATTEALSDISLSIDLGEVVALIGPNGSGKSTLLRCVNDLLRVRRGGVLINSRYHHRSVEAKTSTIMLASNDDLPEFLTGLEFVHLMHSMYRLKIDSRTIKQLFSRYAMAHRERSLIEDYSHGMRKKLQLITALSLRRPLTIIDETLNGVDLDSLYKAEHDIRMLADTGGVLLCSHDFRFLEAVCNRALVLEGGRLIYDVPLPWVRSNYGGLDALARHVLDKAGTWS